MHYPHLTDLKTETPRGIQPAKVPCLIRDLTGGGEELNREKTEWRKEEKSRKQALCGTKGGNVRRKWSLL